MHKWRPKKYSFVYVLIRLTSLVCMCKIQKKCCLRARLVSLISTYTTEYFFGRHLCIRSIKVVFFSSQSHFVCDATIIYREKNSTLPFSSFSGVHFCGLCGLFLIRKNTFQQKKTPPKLKTVKIYCVNITNKRPKSVSLGCTNGQKLSSYSKPPCLVRAKKSRVKFGKWRMFTGQITL